MDYKNMPLFYSFQQINGVSAKKERQYWNNGIEDLYDLKEVIFPQQSFFSEPDIVSPSLDALARKDADFFVERLDKKYYYRIAYSFPKDVMFLDIETTGLSKIYHYVTLIGWIMNGKYDCWIQGMDRDKFLNAFNSAKIIVTYNGTLFDCKFLDCLFQTNAFSEKPHLDLMFLCRRFGLTNGQKKIEKGLGFIRPDQVAESDGKEAVALWYSFLFGNRYALDRLITYNYYDVLGMTYILDWVVFNRICIDEFPKITLAKKFYGNIDLNRESVFPSEVICTAIRKYVKNSISNFKREQLKRSFPFRVIGIDLAGKVSSRTGMCLLVNSEAKTMVAHTDEDIIEAVETYRPDLISIDAPLSLPKGRTSVYDDDPCRSAGILRYSERELKKRGVNSYPALIRSMQMLTQRGIDLADLFRHKGYPVIECFPGAAQDVVQLPRKRTDQSLLKKGLTELGIDGEFRKSSVTHDELDAITAALVGQFFISGFYEPLGIPEENDMIIPQKEYRQPKHKLIIGLAGPTATGKTVAGEYIANKGFEYVRYSLIIERDLRKGYSRTTRSCLRQEGWTLYSGHNQYNLNKELLDYASDSRNMVIDGMRHHEDYTFWKEQGFLNFLLIYIDSNYNIRKKRFIERGNDSNTYDEVIRHPVESNVELLRRKADFVLDNNGTLDQLYGELDDVLQEIRKLTLNG